MINDETNFFRELGWNNLESVHNASIAHQFARYALNISYEILPANVIHTAKRILLDTIACVLAATEDPGNSMILKTIEDLGGKEESTIFGTGLKSNVFNTILINTSMVRCLDYNDCGGGAHNSEAIPSILAVAERERVTGRAFLTAIVISYEIGARIIASIKGLNMQQRGWNSDFRAGLSMPACLGKLMSLNETQIANAIAIAGAHSPILGIVDAHREEMTMAKNLRFAFTAQHAYLSCLLAKRGVTGHIRVVEGDRGINESLLNGDLDLECLVDFSNWRILNTSFKTICHNFSSHPHILATLAIVIEQNLKPEDIASVKIKTTLRESKHVTTFAKKYPRNTESATHSAFFANAMVIKERALGPEQFKPEKFSDPTILKLIEKISVEVDPDLPEYGKTGLSEIKTINGQVFSKRYEVPHGHIKDPLKDSEIELKFKKAAEPYMDKDKSELLIKTIWNIDKLKTMTDFTKRLIWK